VIAGGGSTGGPGGNGRDGPGASCASHVQWPPWTVGSDGFAVSNPLIETDPVASTGWDAGKGAPPPVTTGAGAPLVVVITTTGVTPSSPRLPLVVLTTAITPATGVPVAVVPWPTIAINGATGAVNADKGADAVGVDVTEGATDTVGPEIIGISAAIGAASCEVDSSRTSEDAGRGMYG